MGTDRLIPQSFINYKLLFSLVQDKTRNAIREDRLLLLQPII